MKNIILTALFTCLSFSSFANTYDYKDFNPREVAKACAKSNNKTKSKECYENAKEKNISADIINVCQKFVRNETVVECIDLSFQEGATPAQMEECLPYGDFTNQIFHCITLAGQKNISPNEIRECRLNNPKGILFNPRNKCLMAL